MNFPTGRGIAIPACTENRARFRTASPQSLSRSVARKLSTSPIPSLPARAFGRRFHAAEIHVGADVESGAVVAPSAIASLLAGEDRAE